MAITKGVLVQYKTNNGSVPAITLDQRNSGGTSVVIGSAVEADLLVLGLDNVRVYDVVKDAGTTEAGVTAVGKFWVPA
jgi:hypothetical protein